MTNKENLELSLQCQKHWEENIKILKAHMGEKIKNVSGHTIKFRGGNFMSFDSKDCAFCTFDKGMIGGCYFCPGFIATELRCDDDGPWSQFANGVIGDCLQSKNPVITQKHIDAAQKILDWVNVAVEYFQGKIEDGEM